MRHELVETCQSNSRATAMFLIAVILLREHMKPCFYIWFQTTARSLPNSISAPHNGHGHASELNAPEAPRRLASNRHLHKGSGDDPR